MTKDALKSLKGRPRTQLAQALGEALGKDLSAGLEKRAEEYAPAMPVVPLKSPNSHDYPLGKVCMLACMGSRV